MVRGGREKEKRERTLSETKREERERRLSVGRWRGAVEMTLKKVHEAFQ